MKISLYHSKGCGFYLEVDGESLKKVEQGSDVRFALMEGSLPCGTWLCADLSCLSSHTAHTAYSFPASRKAAFAFQWLKHNPLTLQELIRETHHEFATIQHLPETGWRHLMCVRDHRGFMLNIHSSAFFEPRPSIELAPQKAMCLVRIILVPSRKASPPLWFNAISLAFI